MKVIAAFLMGLMLSLVTTCQVARPKGGVDVPRSHLSRQEIREGAVSGDGCSCETVISLLDSLESCENRSCETASDHAAAGQEAVQEQKIVTVHAGPRKCSGGKGPDIVSVPQTECQPGKVCLDDKGQRALAINLAAYEAFVNKVMDCEGQR